MAAASSFRLLRRFALIVPLALAVGCTGGGSPEPTDDLTPSTPTAEPLDSPTPLATDVVYPLTLIDDEGTNVDLPAKPKKIVSLTPSSTEILFAVGAGSRVVGKVEDVANYPPEAKAIPVVATFSGVDVEKIVALAPDLVISGGSGLTQGPAVEQLRRAKIPTLVVYPTSLGAALDGIRLVGEAVGEVGAANDLADSMRDQFEQVAAQVEGIDRPRTFYEIDATNGIFTPPENSIYSEMLQLAGADPIAGNANYSISLEDLVAADPELILLGDGAYGVTPQAVKKRPGWGGMTAVKTGRIVVVDDVVITRPGPRLVDGLQALLQAIHPELFGASPVPESSGPTGWLPRSDAAAALRPAA